MRNLRSAPTRHLVPVGILVLSAAAAFAAPIHVTYLWHMHQPIYYPYESPQTIDANGRFNFSVQGVWDGDRTGAYTSWPKDAVQAGADRGMPHAGAQISYSGSLGENNNNLWGFCTGATWDDGIDWARNSLRTSRNNPRLDTVGIAYHHSLMPLTCKESMRMQIRLHKEQYRQLWDTSEYSKGFWPPECAFAEWMIPALVDEGLQWVIVDNGHLFRAVPDFPWSSASSCRPNAAEVQNPSSTELGSQWVQLENVWAPTKVLAPWSYQPHYVQYVNPSDGTVKKIIAVPAGRYEGNENGRGGYGAFKPQNVWGAHVGVNDDPAKPMLLLCHSDGDNYGMKNSDAWHGQHEAFLDMCRSNPDFEHTSVQDYIDMYPPDVNDVIHVEPGSWIGIDGGTPYFEKWLSSVYVNGENPDRWSWSVLVAAQNRVLLADSLENSYLAAGSSMDDVEWGINNDTARAWHYFLVAETSCYWYWDLDRANPWDGNVTRACNRAVDEANKVIGRYPASADTQGPSIFPPQRDPYNPGGYMWDENEPASSDFEVWTFVDDVQGLNYVRVYWRTDKDGVNPLWSTQNETYAGGGEVNGWNYETMSGSWDPAVKGPDHIVPDANARAQMYRAMVTGQSQVLIDYYVEAEDTRGNIARSDIAHVYVGQFNSSNVVPVTFFPVLPQDCDDLVVTYNAAGRSLSAASSVTLMLSHDVGTPGEYTMSGTPGGLWRYTNSIPAGARLATVKFRDGATLDDNSGLGWTTDISACAVPPSVVFSPEQPTGCGPVTITYSPGDGPLKNASQLRIHVGYNDWQGVPSPDPTMMHAGGDWTYTYWPPAGAYRIDCCFNDGGSTWDSNNGNDYRVSVSGCSASNTPVVFSPGTPSDCDGTVLLVTYDPAGRSLEGEDNVHIDLRANGGSWWRQPMTRNGTPWEIAAGVEPGTTNIAVRFVNADTEPTIMDDNSGMYWSVAVSSCQTGGPSSVVFSPEAPEGCDDVIVDYLPNEGPLKNAAQVYIHAGRNGWQDVMDEPMTRIGPVWRYPYPTADGTHQINCCFHDGAGTWDNNQRGNWAVSVAACTGAVPVGIRFAFGSPVVTDDPPTNQNRIGDAFDFAESGGDAQTAFQGGFGSFGKMYMNYDEENVYVGARDCDLPGSNNAMVVFLGFNTLNDNAANLWDLDGPPAGLDLLHNVLLDPPADIAILLGDEWGDETFPHFGLPNGYDMGQGVYYLSTGTSAFVPVAGAKLSQYDGAGRAAVTSADDDGDSAMNRWECLIPLSSLGAAGGVEDITNCFLSGLIVSSATNGTDRYISGDYLGTSASGTLDMTESGTNYAFNMVTLEGIPVGLPLADSDNDGIPDDWERGFFSSLAVMGSASDWDKDGAPDRHEHRAGTNPKDSASRLAMVQMFPDPAASNRLVLRWSSVSNRVYRLEYSGDLTNTPVAAIDGLQGNPPENAYTDTVSEAATRFYWIVTEP